VFRIRKEDSGTGVVTGHIFDLQGRPASQAKVSLYQYGYSASSKLAGIPEVRPNLQLVCCASPRDAATRTDDRGEFRLYGISPGHYVVLVGGCRANSTGLSSPGGPSTCGNPLLGATLYPGVSEVSKAVPIEVKAGEETQLGNLALPPPLGKIHVNLVDEGGVALVSPMNIGTVFFLYAGFGYGGFMLYPPILTESLSPVRGQAEMAVNFTGTYVINKGHVTAEETGDAGSALMRRSPLQLLFTSTPSSPMLEPTLLVANVQADGAFRRFTLANTGLSAFGQNGREQTAPMTTISLRRRVRGKRTY
jgi:hypothetical protein